MTNTQFDIVVIGAGIHGAGVAQAAAAAGLSVLILEQSAIAHGTSSRSSKLIHGGLRYLESHQFSLVRECLEERTLLLRLAPDLVQLKPFFIPVYPATTRRPLQLRAGLALYAVLGRFGPGTSFGTVPRQAWDTLDGLNTSGLQTVFRYHDAQTDDAALTRAVIGSACNLGARLDMPARVVHIERHEQGCVVHYQQGDRSITCATGVVVNAAGPWVNTVLDCVTPACPEYHVDLVQGTHLVIDAPLTQGIYYVEAPDDRRAVFVMPWQGRMLVGTTETLYRGDPAQVRPLPQEQDYLLRTLGHYFPALRNAPKVLSSVAGLRVLPTGKGDAFSRPRDTLLHVDDEYRPRVLTIYGGKLTAYRATAERVLARLAGVLPRRRQRADTRTLRLTPIP